MSKTTTPTYYSPISWTPHEGIFGTLEAEEKMRSEFQYVQVSHFGQVSHLRRKGSIEVVDVDLETAHVGQVSKFPRN